LDSLLDHPELLESMRQKAQYYGRPHAAETIVDALLNHPNEDVAKVTPSA